MALQPEKWRKGMGLDVAELERMVGADAVSADPADLVAYGADASVYHAKPWAVVRPRDTVQVRKLLEYCDREKIAVVPRGSGSGMCGQTVPVRGGIVLDMKGMNRIIDINLGDGTCTVEPGVIDDDLNRALKPHGFFWPPTPASSRIATIGGEIGNNASGTRSVKYGAARDSVLALKVVLPGGRLLELGTRTRVASTGYPLERLFVGSEGTLGVIVEATLRYVPIPKFRCLGVANFERLEQAGESITAIMAAGCQPSMLELIDKVAIEAVNRAQNLGLPDVEAILLFEADGMVEQAVDFEIDRISKICTEHGGFGVEYSYDAAEQARMSAGRKKLFPSLSRFSEALASTALADDMAVPYSKMAECARAIHDIAERHGIVMTAYGHCGAGCMHTKILMDTSRGGQWEAARKAIAEIYAFVRKVGGTTSAEHGIGISKAGEFQKEKRPLLDMMRAVKAVFDPNDIMNPGKLLDAPANWLEAGPLRYHVEE